MCVCVCVCVCVREREREREGGGERDLVLFVWVSADEQQPVDMLLVVLARRVVKRRLSVLRGTDIQTASHSATSTNHNEDAMVRYSYRYCYLG